MNRYFKYTVLLLPILFLWVGFNIHRPKYSNDPEYIYLVNAVALANGNNVGHVDNPGTTVMEIGAVSIIAKHWFSNPENYKLAEHVFQQPDQFLEAIQNVILVLNAFILLLLGFAAIIKTGSVWTALFLQASVFISANLLDHVWTKISPEPVLFLVTCIYVIAVLFYYASKNKNYIRYTIIFAVITGAGLATKATFLPLMIFPLFIFPGIKRKLLYVAGVIASFVFFTIPAIPEYKGMYYWFRGLITHSGKYGQGEKQLIDFHTYLPNIVSIFKNNPVFIVVFGMILLALAVFAVQKIRNKERLFNDEFRITAGLTATFIFGILLVAKHYNANHYLIPVLLLSGILIYFSANLIFDTIKLSRKRNSFFAFITILLMAYLTWRQPPVMRETDYYYRISAEEIDSTNQMIERKYPDYTVINYYATSLNKFTALRFGDVYTINKTLPILQKVYPQTYFYDFDNNHFTNWDTKITLDTIIQLNSNKILLINGPFGEGQVKEMEARGIPLKNIYRGRVQIIYELDTLKYQEL